MKKHYHQLVRYIEPELGYKVVFLAAAFQRSPTQWLVTQVTRCLTLYVGRYGIITLDHPKMDCGGGCQGM